jgi:hypothetical protein
MDKTKAIEITTEDKGTQVQIEEKTASSESTTSSDQEYISDEETVLRMYLGKDHFNF